MGVTGKSRARDFASKGISLSLNNRFVPGKEEAVAAVVSHVLVAGMAAPALNEPINYVHGISTVDSTMDLVQAQRDYFDSHGYQLKHDTTGKTFHMQREKGAEIL